MRLPRSTQLDLGDVRAALSSTEALPAGKAAFERLAAMLESEEHLAALERARVVVVLDTYADKLRKDRPLHHVDLTVRFDTDGRYVVMLPGRGYHGDSPDRARAAAAAAIEKGEV